MKNIMGNGELPYQGGAGPPPRDYVIAAILINCAINEKCCERRYMFQIVEAFVAVNGRLHHVSARVQTHTRTDIIKRRPNYRVLLDKIKTAYVGPCTEQDERVCQEWVSIIGRFTRDDWMDLNISSFQ